MQADWQACAGKQMVRIDDRFFAKKISFATAGYMLGDKFYESNDGTAYRLKSDESRFLFVGTEFFLDMAKDSHIYVIGTPIDQFALPYYSVHGEIHCPTKFQPASAVAMVFRGPSRTLGDGVLNIDHVDRLFRFFDRLIYNGTLFEKLTLSDLFMNYDHANEAKEVFVLQTTTEIGKDKKAIVGALFSQPNGILDVLARSPQRFIDEQAFNAAIFRLQHLKRQFIET